MKINLVIPNMKTRVYLLRNLILIHSIKVKALFTHVNSFTRVY